MLAAPALPSQIVTLIAITPSNVKRASIRMEDCAFATGGAGVVTQPSHCAANVTSVPYDNYTSRSDMMKNILVTLVAATGFGLAAIASTAGAANITGAGATFP
jgi:hypothetical protein